MGPVVLQESASGPPDRGSGMAIHTSTFFANANNLVSLCINCFIVRIISISLSDPLTIPPLCRNPIKGLFLLVNVAVSVEILWPALCKPWYCFHAWYR